MRDHHSHRSKKVVIHRLGIERLERRNLLASDAGESSRSGLFDFSDGDPIRDVNQDGFISPIDLLLRDSQTNAIAVVPSASSFQVRLEITDALGLAMDTIPWNQPFWLEAVVVSDTPLNHVQGTFEFRFDQRYLSVVGEPSGNELFFELEQPTSVSKGVDTSLHVAGASVMPLGRQMTLFRTQFIASQETAIHVLANVNRSGFSGDSSRTSYSNRFAISEPVVHVPNLSSEAGSNDQRGPLSNPFPIIESKVTDFPKAELPSVLEAERLTAAVNGSNDTATNLTTELTEMALSDPLFEDSFVADLPEPFRERSSMATNDESSSNRISDAAVFDVMVQMEAREQFEESTDAPERFVSLKSQTSLENVVEESDIRDDPEGRVERLDSGTRNNHRMLRRSEYSDVSIFGKAEMLRGLIAKRDSDFTFTRKRHIDSRPPKLDKTNEVIAKLLRDLELGSGSQHSRPKSLVRQAPFDWSLQYQRHPLSAWSLFCDQEMTFEPDFTQRGLGSNRDLVSAIPGYSIPFQRAQLSAIDFSPQGFEAEETASDSTEDSDSPEKWNARGPTMFFALFASAWAAIRWQYSKDNSKDNRFTHREPKTVARRDR